VQFIKNRLSSQIGQCFIGIHNKLANSNHLNVIRFNSSNASLSTMKWSGHYRLELIQGFVSPKWSEHCLRELIEELSTKSISPFCFGTHRRALRRNQFTTPNWKSFNFYPLSSNISENQTNSETRDR
jgi:hypothetical protein